MNVRQFPSQELIDLGLLIGSIQQCGEVCAHHFAALLASEDYS